MDQSWTTDSPTIGRSAEEVDARPEPLSPGADGDEFNPLVVAEFRRWRAKPIQYLAMVVLVLCGIVYLYLSRDSGAAAFLPAMANRELAKFLESYISLLARPSTILPVMMVWRALVSFRDGGLYEPFRTTFLTPAAFLWGVIAVPFAVSALLVVGYTGWVLGPNIVERAFVLSPEQATPTPIATIAGILLEGGLNGAAICFLALYCGVRWGARLTALAPVVLGVLLLEGLQAGVYAVGEDLLRPLRAFPSMGWGAHARALWPYAVQAAPKALLAAILWWATARRLGRTPDAE